MHNRIFKIHDRMSKIKRSMIVIRNEIVDEGRIRKVGEMKSRNICFG